MQVSILVNRSQHAEIDILDHVAKLIKIISVCLSHFVPLDLSILPYFELSTSQIGVTTYSKI